MAGPPSSQSELSHEHTYSYNICRLINHIYPILVLCSSSVVETPKSDSQSSSGSLSRSSSVVSKEDDTSQDGSKASTGMSTTRINCS